MAEDQPVERKDEESQEELAERESSENGSGQAPDEYEEGLARPAAPTAGDTLGDDGRPAPDFEADIHELQAELGEDWTLRFSVHGEDGWLTAERLSLDGEMVASLRWPSSRPAPKLHRPYPSRECQRAGGVEGTRVR